MQVSAEIRWFWHRAPPVGLEAWFCTADFHGCPAGGGALRVDEYLRDTSQAELGLKRRGGKKGIELKGLVEIAAKRLAVEPYTGPVELWTKWTSLSLELDTQATVKTEKQRWLRKFDTATKTVREVPVDSEEKPIDKQPLPAMGCNVELTRVKLTNSEDWWTLGFEAFGTMQNVQTSLRAVAGTLAARQSPALESGQLASYPKWLSEHARA